MIFSLASSTFIVVGFCLCSVPIRHGGFPLYACYFIFEDEKQKQFSFVTSTKNCKR